MKYHGSEQGWDDLLAQTKTTPVPPAGFTIAQYVPPTPQQQAADLVKTKKPEEMSFAEWELVLSVGTPEDQDKVWNSLKGKNLQMAEVQVITASPTKLELAASVDDIDQKRADIELAFPGAIPARMVPKEGDKINFEGTPVSYTPKPFVMVMEKGALLTKAAPAPGQEAAGAQEAAVDRVQQRNKRQPTGAALIFACDSLYQQFQTCCQIVSLRDDRRLMAES